MKKIVIYQTETGYSEKYANWIANDLECEARKLENINLNELSNYDLVIYGGWILGGNIVGYDKIKKLNLNNVVVFGVGMSIPSKETANKIAEQNQIPQEHFFYFEGGYNPNKLGFFKKMMVNMAMSSVKKKENKTADDLHTLETLKGADRTNKESIKALVEFCK